MSTTPADRQATLSSWMEDVDPKFRADTYFLMTHNLNPNLYWKWDVVPTRPPGMPIDSPTPAKEGFCGSMCGQQSEGCSCSCSVCPDCGMTLCHCRCSYMNRMLGTCKHHKGKLLLILLILIALGVLVFNMPEQK